MLETTSAALCFTTFSTSASSISPFHKESLSATTLSSLSSSSSLSSPIKFSPVRPRSPPSRCFRFIAKASGSASPGSHDDYGHYPWESSDTNSSIQWVREERVTLFTADGLVQIGGNLVPKRIPDSDKQQGKLKMSNRFQRFRESDYMDPDQGLCLGALFDIAATNGLDTGRRLCIFGFCRSIEMLSDVVEDTVLEHGGEVVAAERAVKGGLHEKLTMIVAVPLLWGVPPASETLHLAVRSGGGIVEKVYWQWNFF